ncbi:Vacuolar protein sorting-associated protein 68 [Paramarasmius palmivorus]|uniref:Vacuolar protein sorting-associated protein 68 n=1 Tax=Paramarasmius palmivorus TaxID=297713 RepID=A0AAW0CRT8_9AGAR
MFSFDRRPSYTSPSSPVEVEVQVQVEVHGDDDIRGPEMESVSHGTAAASAPRWQAPFSSIQSFLSVMSLPRADYDPRRVCLNPFPNIHLGKHRRTIGVYAAGALVCHKVNVEVEGKLTGRPIFKFALAHWVFLDAAILSAHAKVPWGDEPPVHVSFVDWVPGICSLLGYAVVNLIDKDRVKGEEGFGDPRSVWRARLFLFIGFALMAGGLAGSVVSVMFWHNSPRPFNLVMFSKSTSLISVHYRQYSCSSTS